MVFKKNHKQSQGKGSKKQNTVFCETCSEDIFEKGSIKSKGNYYCSEECKELFEI